MANKGTISQKIELTGEAQYNATLKSVNRNLKTLKSELKAETKELGNNATAEQKAEVQAKNLRKQIAEQEKAVKACRDALEEAKEKYGDNEQAVSTYEVKLNNARAALADMKNQLDSVGGSLQQNATDLEAVKTAANTGVTATESFANALEKVSSVGSTVSGAIEGVFNSMVDVVSGAVSDMWALISETASKANNWTDTAALWGTDAQTVQMWSRAMSAAGKDLSSLETVISRLVLGGKGKQITELLGISDVNYTDQWEYATTAMDLLYEKYKQGEDITPITEQIFGEKKSTTVIDLLNAWEDIRKGLGTFNGDETGYGLTSEGLEMFNKISLQMFEIETKWDALKERFAEGFGETTLTLQAHVIGGLDALADFMNAESDEERQAALDKLTEEVEGFARDAAAAIEAGIEALSQIGSSLKESDNPYVAAVGNLFDGIANTLQWIVENAEDVGKALRAIFDVWLLSKAASLVGQLGSMVAYLAVIKSFLGNAGTAGAGAATAAGAQNLLGNLGTTFTNLGGKIGTAVSGFGTFGLNNLGVVGDWFSNNTRIGRAVTRGDEGVGEAITGTVEELAQNIEQNASTFTDDWARLGITVKEALTGQEVGSGGFSEFEVPEPEKTNEGSNHGLLLNGEKAAEAVDAIIAEVQKALAQQNGPELAELYAPTYGSGLTEEQIDAAENYWDFLKNWGLTGEGDFDAAYDAFEAAFGSDSALFDAVDDMMEQLAQKYDLWSDMPEDLPGSWWESLTGAEALKKSDISEFSKVPSGMVTAVENALKNGLSGVKVEMDGQTVGNLLLPYINQGLAIAML